MQYVILIFHACKNVYTLHRIHANILYFLGMGIGTGVPIRFTRSQLDLIVHFQFDSMNSIITPQKKYNNLIKYLLFLTHVSL